MEANVFEWLTVIHFRRPFDGVNTTCFLSEVCILCRA
jgi:hypothetical protein